MNKFNKPQQAPPETQALSPTDILKSLIIQRRNAVLDAIEQYYQVMSATQSSAPVHFVRARILTLFFELEPMLARTLADVDFQVIQEKAYSEQIQDNINAFRKMSLFLDVKNVTRVDTSIKIDSTNAEYENTFKNL